MAENRWEMLGLLALGCVTMLTLPLPFLAPEWGICSDERDSLLLPIIVSTMFTNRRKQNKTSVYFSFRAVVFC